MRFVLVAVCVACLFVESALGSAANRYGLDSGVTQCLRGSGARFLNEAAAERSARWRAISDRITIARSGSRTTYVWSRRIRDGREARLYLVRKGRYAADITRPAIRRQARRAALAVIKHLNSPRQDVVLLSEFAASKDRQVERACGLTK
jgi:hypothetical protein